MTTPKLSNDLTHIYGMPPYTTIVEARRLRSLTGKSRRGVSSDAMADQRAVSSYLAKAIEGLEGA